jgi:poly(3-hydroxybutyrate) depolymerase
MLYQLHELHRAWLAPVNHVAEASARILAAHAGFFPASSGVAAPMAAAYELLHRLGKDYPKPSFGVGRVEISGSQVAVIEQSVFELPFCRLLRFKRYGEDEGVIQALKQSPVVLVVAPLAGHHATLLRETVSALLVDHDVYVTDWHDARTVPVEHGRFTLEDYVGYLRAFIRRIEAPAGLHVIAVCQPGVPVLGVVSLMAAAGEAIPKSLTLMGSPIDTRVNPTRVNAFATERPLAWFERNVLCDVPARYRGRGRRVYPGFLQHASFVAMDPARHLRSHLDFFHDLVNGAVDAAAAHRRFYDEYNAVLDMPAEYYLDCIRIVFQEHQLARGLWDVGGQRVAPEAIRDSALLTIEGEHDDISGRGQTQAAHTICSSIPAHRKHHLTVAGAGHYGIFTGRRWRELVYPRVRDFIRSAARRASSPPPRT